MSWTSLLSGRALWGGALGFLVFDGGALFLGLASKSASSLSIASDFLFRVGFAAADFVVFAGRSSITTSSSDAAVSFFFRVDADLAGLTASSSKSLSPPLGSSSTYSSSPFPGFWYSDAKISSPPSPSSSVIVFPRRVCRFGGSFPLASLLVFAPFPVVSPSVGGSGSFAEVAVFFAGLPFFLLEAK